MADNVTDLFTNPLTLLNPEAALQDVGTGQVASEGVKKALAKPVTPKAEAAPIPDDLKKKRAKQRAIQRKYADAGRAGTMLTSGDNKLG